MNKLEKLLLNKFPNKKIVTLKDLAEKISIISKVRYGHNKTFTDYDEISLRNIDEYGYIYISENDKPSEPANETAVKNQELHESDLIILHRGKVGKMGIIGKEYKRKIVGNNSMIRIQFKQNRKVDTPWFVMQYLQLDYVKEYLNTLAPACGSNKRKILNSEMLKELPIPEFKEQGGLFKELLFERKHFLLEADHLVNKIGKLKSEYETLIDESVQSVINESDILPRILDTQKKKFDELNQLSNEFDSYFHNTK